jgi:hypothetical protein
MGYQACDPICEYLPTTPRCSERLYFRLRKRVARDGLAMNRTSAKAANKLPSGSEAPPDPAELLIVFLAFVRRYRAAILSEAEPLAFCLYLADNVGTCPPTAAAALGLLGDLTGDVRDYAVSSAYALLIGPEKRKRLSAYFTPPSLTAAAMEAATGNVTLSIADAACMIERRGA